MKSKRTFADLLALSASPYRVQTRVQTRVRSTEHESAHLMDIVDAHLTRGSNFARFVGIVLRRVGIEPLSDYSAIHSDSTQLAIVYMCAKYYFL